MMVIKNQIIDWWMFWTVQKPYLLILANLQSNKRQKKETIRFSHRFFAYMHLSKREIFHSYKKSQKFFIFFLAFLINHLVWRSKKCRFIRSSDRPVPEFGDRCSWEKLVTVPDFKRHLRQNYGSSQRFVWWFSEMKWWVIKGNRDLLYLSSQGEIYDLKVVT